MRSLSASNFFRSNFGCDQKCHQVLSFVSSICPLRSSPGKAALPATITRSIMPVGRDLLGRVFRRQDLPLCEVDLLLDVVLADVVIALDEQALKPRILFDLDKEIDAALALVIHQYLNVGENP